MQNNSSVALNQRSISPDIRFCAVVGPTASGKTALSLELAEALGCEILCADAMQVYRKLDVGSAKPTFEERRRVAHHGINLVSPLENFSASRYAQYAERFLEKAAENDAPLVLCGGTGLYYRALLEGLFETPDPDPQLRAHLNQRVADEGSPSLHAELEVLDAETARAIHPNDARRITRALEIIAQTGSSVSEHRRNQKRKSWLENTRFIGLDWEKEDLDRRIEKRTIRMYENGLIDETRMMVSLGCSFNHTAMQALGYKECYAHLLGKISLQAAVETTIIETQKYAKRQYTWFRRQFPTIWLKINTSTDLCQMVNESLQLLRKSDNNIPSSS